MSTEKTHQRSEESEIQLRMIIQSTHIGTWEYYPLSGELNWSEECRNIFAIPAHTKIDFETFAERVHPEDRDFVIREIQKAMRPDGDGYYDIRYRIQRFASDEVRWIHARGKTFFDESRQCDRFLGTVIDITDLRKREESLKESELKSRLVMEASGMGSFVNDLTHVDFRYSGRMAEIFGFGNPASTLSPQQFVERIHSDDLEIRNQAHERMLETGTLFYEARVVWPDESIHWMRVNGKLVFDSKGSPSRIYGTVMDITHQKNEARELEKLVLERTLSLEKRNRDLQRSEERYQRVIAEVQDYAIILLDPNGIIQTWNKGAEKIKRYSEAEIVGKHFSIFYLPEDQQRMLPQQLIAEAEKNGRAVHEGWRRRKDGTTFWGSITITALHNPLNEIIGFSKVTRDLTDKKKAEDQLLEYTRQLESQNKELEQFAYVASHDLQEPLRKIQTFASIMQKNADNKTLVAQYLQKIEIASARLSQLVKSLLDYSRLSAATTYEEPVDLNVTVAGVKIDFELLLEETQTQISSTTLPTIKGHPIQLSQLFANLIGNAIKFRREAPKISISSRRISKEEVKNNPGDLKHNHYLEISFDDNGIGFDEKYLTKIFTIFQRLHPRHEFEGAGIGLALCKKIMIRHDGYLTGESSPGAGSTFYAYFPAEALLGEAPKS